MNQLLCNSWTLSDFDTVCRELGFRGGRFYRWMEGERRGAGHDRRPARLLLETPSCSGSESSLQDCRKWRDKQLGAGVCDFHGDVGVECEQRHALDQMSKVSDLSRSYAKFILI